MLVGMTELRTQIPMSDGMIGICPIRFDDVDSIKPTTTTT